MATLQDDTGKTTQELIDDTQARIAWYGRRIKACQGRAARLALEDQQAALVRYLRELQEVQDAEGSS